MQHNYGPILPIRGAVSIYLQTNFHLFFETIELK